MIRAASFCINNIKNSEKRLIKLYFCSNSKDDKIKNIKKKFNKLKNNKTPDKKSDLSMLEKVMVKQSQIKAIILDKSHDDKLKASTGTFIGKSELKEDEKIFDTIIDNYEPEKKKVSENYPLKKEDENLSKNLIDNNELEKKQGSEDGLGKEKETVDLNHLNKFPPKVAFSEDLFDILSKNINLEKEGLPNLEHMKKYLDNFNKKEEFDKIPFDMTDALNDLGYHQVSKHYDDEIIPTDRNNFLKNVDPSKRLNIFDKEDMKNWTVEKEEETINIMDIVDSWQYRQMVLMPPENQFDEWLMLTKDKKLWKFPIDNEQDSAELNVGFHEHVFPQQYLSGRLPTTGIIGQYMNLVVLGLSQSPHLTVAQKKEHIKWYEEYFAARLTDINIAVEKSKEEQMFEKSLRKQKN